MAAIEERDGVRFYVDRTSPLRRSGSSARRASAATSCVDLQPPLRPRRSSAGRAASGRRASSRRADVGEDLAVRRHRALGVGRRREQRAGADDVVADAPASASAARTISQQRRACSGVDSGSRRRASPDRCRRRARDRRPDRAREADHGSYGEPDAICRRAARRAPPARARGLADQHVVGVVGRDREDRDAGVGERRRRATASTPVSSNGIGPGSTSARQPSSTADVRRDRLLAGRRSTARPACG